MNINILIIVIIIIFITLAIYFQVKDYYSQNDEVILQLKKDLRKVHPAADKVKIYKSGSTSYTINKKHIYLCMLDENNQYYDKNTLFYVLCHELAHSLSESIGHTEEFDHIFKRLLKRAEDLGLYNSSQKIPENYCNYKIN